MRQPRSRETELRLSQFKHGMAPMKSNWRMTDFPSFENRPKRSLPPGECRRGKRLAQAAESRPRLKLAMSGANASTATAVSGSTTGVSAAAAVFRFLAPAFSAARNWPRSATSSTQSGLTPVVVYAGKQRHKTRASACKSQPSNPSASA